MEHMFENDLKQSTEILLEQWEKRPLSERLKEWFARLFAHWL
jgi:cardiolipin synthase